MNQSRREAKDLIETIRGLMKQRHLRYHHLASALEISSPTVKRMFSSGEMPLSRLAEIASWLNLSLFDLVELSRKKKPQQFKFNLEQEKFFAQHPHFLAYLFAIYQAKQTPEEIEKQYKISKKSTQGYLRKLEQLGLIERQAGSRVRALMSGSVYWDDHGILGQTFSRKMIEALADHTLRKLGKPEKLHLMLSGWRLTSNDYEQLKKDLHELSIKYRRISDLNAKILQKGETNYLSTMFISDFWDAKVFSVIIELS